MKYSIRNVESKDLEQVAAVEEVCFPKAEAAGKEDFRQRMEAFPESFFIAEEEGGRIIGFINGAVTERKTICDEMFEDVSFHDKNGAYQSVFGLDVIPERQKKGVASALMKHLIEKAKEQGRKGVILTCKEGLIPFYERFGYKSLGISQSVHGGAVWYDMLLEF